MVSGAWRLAAALALSTALAAAPARATTLVEVPPERSRTQAIAEALRDELARALVDHPSGAIVVRVRAELGEAPRGHALITALVAPALAALEAEPQRFPLAHLASFDPGGEEPATRAGRLGYASLVDVSVRSLGNFLHVDASVWTTEPATQRAGFALRSRVDAELRAYLGGLERVSEQTIVARVADLPGRGYLAMAAADLDGDGRTELALIGADAVSIVRLGASRVGVRLVQVARAHFGPEVPAAPFPTRRALATAVARDRAVVARVAGRAAPLTVSLEGARASVSRASGPCPDGAFPIDAGCAELSPGRDFFDDDITRPTPAGPAPHQTPGTFYVHASRTLRTREGQVVSYEAIVTPHGRLAVRAGERSVGAVGYGTALAMADLDDDGAAELLTSGAQAAGAGDQLTLLRVLPRGALHVVWRSEPLAGPVWIAGHGDLDGDGLEELLAIEEPLDPRGVARLWIVR